MSKYTMELSKAYLPKGRLFDPNFDVKSTLEQIIAKDGNTCTVSAKGEKYTIDTIKPIDPLILLGFRAYFDKITEEKK